MKHEPPLIVALDGEWFGGVYQSLSTRTQELALHRENWWDAQLWFQCKWSEKEGWLTPHYLYGTKTSWRQR